MELSNQKILKQTEQLRRVLALLSAMAIAALAYWYSTMPTLCFYAAWAFIALVVLVFAYHAITGLSFFSFEQVGDILIFKYYSTGNFSYKRMKIAIPQADFTGYTIKSSFFNRRHTLTLTETIKGRQATYPPLSISYLSTNQRVQLSNALSKLVTRNG